MTDGARDTAWAAVIAIVFGTVALLALPYEPDSDSSKEQTMTIPAELDGMSRQAREGYAAFRPGAPADNPYMRDDAPSCAVEAWSMGYELAAQHEEARRWRQERERFLREHCPDKARETLDRP